jgi:GDPmannose 4,6-dehydratase
MGRPIVQGGKLSLGNLEIARDWGHAADFVRAMWLMLQREQADDYVIGTGKIHTLRDLCEIAYRSVGRDWTASVVSDPALVRPLESGQTLADAGKARRELGWEPTVSFEEMVARMVQAQVQRLTMNQRTR